VKRKNVKELNKPILYGIVVFLVLLCINITLVAIKISTSSWETDTDFSVSETNALRSEAENAIKMIVKSPSTAEFAGSSEWHFEKKAEENIAVVQSSVEYQNSFGMKEKEQFVLEYEIVSGVGRNEYTLLYARIGNVTYLDNKD